MSKFELFGWDCVCVYLGKWNVHVRKYPPFSVGYLLLLILIWQIFIGLDEARNPLVYLLNITVMLATLENSFQNVFVF